MPVSHSLGWLHGCPESHTIPVSVMQEEVESRHYRDEKQGTEKTKARHLSASSLLALDLQMLPPFSSQRFRCACHDFCIACAKA